MKKFLIATALLASANLANADQKLVSADGSQLSALCLAAAAAPADLIDTARAHGITVREIDTVRCNGIALKRFVLKYGNTETVTTLETPAASDTVAGYLLRKTDSSPLTELCAAAAISEQEYAKVKQQHFSEERDIDAEVQCNGLSLRSFVRKFRDAEVRLVGLR